MTVAIHTGIRQGALLGLRWCDVKWMPKPQIHVPDRLSKNRRSYVVPMSPTVREALRGLSERAGFTGSEDFVFCKRDGSRRRSIRTAWDHACEKAGLQNLRFHDLRHTAASRIVMAGGTLYDARQHLGQRTAAMTQRYAHLSADHQERIAELTEISSVPIWSHSPAGKESESA